MYYYIQETTLLKDYPVVHNYGSHCRGFFINGKWEVPESITEIGYGHYAFESELEAYEYFNAIADETKAIMKGILSEGEEVILEMVRCDSEVMDIYLDKRVVIK